MGKRTATNGDINQHALDIKQHISKKMKLFADWDYHPLFSDGIKQYLESATTKTKNIFTVICLTET